jgi:hypothetical protein
MDPSCNEKMHFIACDVRDIIQHLEHLNASVRELIVKAMFQICLVEASMKVMSLFREDLVNVAPLDVIGAVIISPWIRHVLPPLECKLGRVT